MAVRPPPSSTRARDQQSRSVSTIIAQAIDSGSGPYLEQLERERPLGKGEDRGHVGSQLAAELQAHQADQAKRGHGTGQGLRHGTGHGG